MPRDNNQIDNPKCATFWRAVVAEFMAMFMFVFICVGCAITNGNFLPGPSTLSISVSFGLTIFVLVHIFGPVSGGHINPAVTIALTAMRKLSPKRAAAYIIAQCLGSIAASMVLKSMVAEGHFGGWNHLTGTTLSHKLVRAAIAEFFLTFLLVMTVCATIDPFREESSLGIFAIGMAVTVAHLIAVPIDGCGINPARSLGPALLSGNGQAMADLWIFLVFPILGGLVAAALYKFVFAAREIDLQTSFRETRDNDNSDNDRDLQTSDVVLAEAGKATGATKAADGKATGATKAAGSASGAE